MREAVFMTKGLTKVYRMGEVTVETLRGIDLELYSGELVVLLGPSGSGKSTLLNILGGLDTATDGRVVYRGRELTKATEQELTEYRRFHVGFVFQFYKLIPSLTTLENVAVVTEIVGKPMKPEDALDIVGSVKGWDIFPRSFPAANSSGSRSRVQSSEAFAEAHGFSPGDTLGAVINGRWKTLVIVGIALSPEFVLQVRPGAISPDYKCYGILWMSRNALGTAYDMDGAFNDVVLTLTRNADLDDVLVRLDNIIARYGGLGSYGREDQLSNRFLTEEFRQLQRSAEIFPTIFISVGTRQCNTPIFSGRGGEW